MTDIQSRAQRHRIECSTRIEGWLKRQPSQEAKMLVANDRELSAADMIQEVRDGTELGNLLLELFADETTAE